MSPNVYTANRPSFMPAKPQAQYNHLISVDKLLKKVTQKMLIISLGITYSVTILIYRFIYLSVNFS